MQYDDCNGKSNEFFNSNTKLLSSLSDTAPRSITVAMRCSSPSFELTSITSKFHSLNNKKHIKNEPHFISKFLLLRLSMSIQDITHIFVICRCRPFDIICRLIYRFLSIEYGRWRFLRWRYTRFIIFGFLSVSIIYVIIVAVNIKPAYFELSVIASAPIIYGFTDH